MSKEWRPVAAADLEHIVEGALSRCSDEQRAVFALHRAPFYQVPIRRRAKMESVYVVATFGERVLYFEDVEEGFALTVLDETGGVSEPDCNQLELGQVLDSILNGRTGG